MKCDQCGACCRMFSLLPKTSELLDLDDGTGKCKFLVGNLCSVYEERPWFCNSDTLYRKLFFTICSKEEFDEIMEETCKNLKNKAGDVDE